MIEVGDGIIEPTLLARAAAELVPDIAAPVEEEHASWRVRWAQPPSGEVHVRYFGSELAGRTQFHTIFRSARDRGLELLRLEQRCEDGRTWTYRSRGVPMAAA